MFLGRLDPYANICSMGNAGNGDPPYALGLFDKAIEEGRLDAAWRNASSVTHLTLDRALRLTVLMSQEKGSGAERLARRFIERFMREYDPSLRLIGMVVEALRSSSRDGHMGEDARIELRELADRMQRRRDLDSWPGP